MAEHLTLERISALLDEPWVDLDAEAHLERCGSCRVEYERLSRTRMAISALGELDPPAGEWAAIEARLDASLREDRSVVPLRNRAAGKLLRSPALQAAAALTLFAGGVLAGLQFTGSGPTADAPTTAAAVSNDARGELPVALPASNGEAAYLNAVAEMETLGLPLRRASLSRPDGSLDPIATAELIRRLDAAIEASREAVMRSPENPLASATLFQLVDYRSELASRLDQSAHLTRAEAW
jgi:hypothetical protein